METYLPPTPEERLQRHRQATEELHAKHKRRQRSDDALVFSENIGLTSLHPLFPPTPVHTPKRQKRTKQSHQGLLLPSTSILARNPFKVFADSLAREDNEDHQAVSDEQGNISNTLPGPTLDPSSDNPFVDSISSSSSKKNQSSVLGSPANQVRSPTPSSRKHTKALSPCKDGEFLFVYRGTRIKRKIGPLPDIVPRRLFPFNEHVDD